MQPTSCRLSNLLLSVSRLQVVAEDSYLNEVQNSGEWEGTLSSCLCSYESSVPPSGLASYTISHHLCVCFFYCSLTHILTQTLVKTPSVVFVPDRLSLTPTLAASSPLPRGKEISALSRPRTRWGKE